MSEMNITSMLDLLRQSEVLNSTELENAQNLAQQSADVKAFAVQLIRQNVLTSWQAKFLLTGRSRLKLGRYTLLDRLERSDFGDRFIALHQGLGRKVELQLLTAEWSRNRPIRDRFMEQAQRSAELDHPHLVHVYDVDQEGGRFFLVSEYAEGRSLFDDHVAAEFTFSELASQLSGIADGISQAHAHGVIHGKIDRRSLFLVSQVESEINPGATGKIMVGNFALAGFIDELHQPSAEDDMRVGLAEIDDWILFGRTGLELLELAIRDVSDAERRELRSSVSAFAALREPVDESLPQALKRLKNCSRRILQESIEAGAKPNEAPSKEKATKHRTVAAQDTAEQPSKSGSFLIPALALGAVVLLVSGLAAVYILMFGFGNRTQASTNDADTDRQTGLEQKGESKKAVVQADGNEDPSGNGIDQDPKTSDPGNQETLGETNDSVNPVDAKSGEQNSSKVGEEPKTAGQPPNKDEQKIVGSQNPLETASLRDPEKKNEDRNTDSNQQETAELPAPFSEIQNAVQLPATTDSNESILGKVYCGDRHLLGVTLLWRDGLVGGSVKFELKLAPGENAQRWLVYFRNRNVKEEIGQFWLEQTAFKFRWSDKAKSLRLAGFFQNGILRLETRDRPFFLRLRRPAEIGTMKIDPSTMKVEKEFPLEFLPKQGVIYEMQKAKFLSDQGKDRPLYFKPQNRRVESHRDSFFVYASKEDLAKIYWIQIDMRVGKTTKISSRFQMIRSLQDTRGRAFSKAAINQLHQAILASEKQLDVQIARMKAYSPSEEQRSAFAKQLEELEKQKEGISQINTYLGNYIPMAEQFGKIPIRLRVYYEIDGHQVDLATHDGQPFQVGK